MTEPVLLTREQLLQHLNDRGYPVTASYLNKACLPSINAGPPVAKYWGRRPLYHLDAALAWAEVRSQARPKTRRIPIGETMSGKQDGDVYKPSEADWDGIVKLFAKTGHWSMHVGPDPTSKACRCPKEILRRYDINLETGERKPRPRSRS